MGSRYAFCERVRILGQRTARRAEAPAAPARRDAVRRASEGRGPSVGAKPGPLTDDRGDRECCGAQREEDGADQPAQGLRLGDDGGLEATLLLGDLEQRLLQL